MKKIPDISSEPSIVIGLCGENECAARPTDNPERHIIEGIEIGRGFHWMQKRTISVEGELSAGHGYMLLRLPIERYVTSVISSEMNPQAHSEFLKAHAIISRGWALGKVLHLHHEGGGRISTPERIVTWTDTEAHNDFDVCPDDHCQRFQGFDYVNEKATAAVEATRGIILINSNGELTDARFSKCCGGQTELFSTCWQETDYPEISSVVDPYCDLSGLSSPERKDLLGSIMKDYDAATTDFYRWERHVTRDLIRSRLKELFSREIGNILSLKAIERGASGRIKYLQINGSEGSIILGKELAIRRVLSTDCLYSSAFEIYEGEDGFTLRGKGWGHGVGLCQLGAARMAAEGATYLEILNHYYPGAKPVKLYD